MRATQLRRGYVVPGIDEQTDRSNGAFGKSDIEGKIARVAASELGKERVSNARERMSQSFRSSCARRRINHLRPRIGFSQS